MQFSALRPTHKDEANMSIEMLNLRRESSSTDNHHQQHNPTLRSSSQSFPWRTFIIISLLPLCLAPIIILSVVAESASQNYIRGRSCYPNGLWKEAADATWEIMDSTYFFTPNLSFGSMTFTQVKVIDIAWDLIIGRGGQMCLGWVNWRVFNEWLVYHLEMHCTSYKMYTAIAFQTTSLGTLGVLAKEFLYFGERTWRRFFRWLAMFCMLISTLYVLAFPTLMGAMTGYITTYEPYLEDYGRNLIKWGQVEQVVGMIEDAERIEFEKPLLVTGSNGKLYEAFKNCKCSGLVSGLVKFNTSDLS
jgi:hypothetical protein